MKRIKEIKNKLSLTIFYIVILIVFGLLKIPCLFKLFFKIECIGCGMTRAILSALRFDFKAAFTYHWMFWSIPILYIYFLFDGGIFKKKIIDIIILGLISLGFVINGVLKLV